jgi:hypothetical protein
MRKKVVMDQLTIFSATLGLSLPWQVTSVSFDSESNRLDICVEYTQGSPLVCPLCGAQGASCSETRETWYHKDFLRYGTYLHARVPQVDCCSGLVPLERPWCRAGSKFSRII